MVELGVQREDATLFALCNPFQLPFVHNQYTPSIASVEQEMKAIMEQEVATE